MHSLCRPTDARWLQNSSTRGEEEEEEETVHGEVLEAWRDLSFLSRGGDGRFEKVREGSRRFEVSSSLVL